MDTFVSKATKNLFISLCVPTTPMHIRFAQIKPLFIVILWLKLLVIILIAVITSQYWSFEFNCERSILVNNISIVHGLSGQYRVTHIYLPSYTMDDKIFVKVQFIRDFAFLCSHI